IAEASSLSRRNTLRPEGSATSMSGCPSPQRGQSRPPLQVRRHIGQIFSIVRGCSRAPPPAVNADCRPDGPGTSLAAPMDSATFDFFYDLSSPYSYLASTQLRGI